MKNTKLLLFALCSLFLLESFQNIAFADAKAWRRYGNGTCWFFYKRFRTTGEVNSKQYYAPGQYSYNCYDDRPDRGCNWSYSFAKCPNIPNLWAEARSDWNGQWARTSKNPNAWWESAGPKKPILSRDNWLPYSSDEEETGTGNSSNKAEISIGESSYSNGTIKINNLSGLVSISKSELEHGHGSIIVRAITIKNESEEEPSPEQVTVLSESKMIIKAGKLYLSGILNERNVTYSDDGDNLILQINLKSEISLGVNLPEENVILEVGSDLGSLLQGEPKSEFNTDENTLEVQLSTLTLDNHIPSLELKIYGNPTSSDHIQYLIKSNIDKTVNISIIDVHGNIKLENSVEELKSGIVYEFNEKFSSNLQPGIYFLRILDGNSIKFKTFLVE